MFLAEVSYANDGCIYFIKKQQYCEKSLQLI